MIIKKRLFAIITLLVLVITGSLVVSAISAISRSDESNEYEIKTEEFFIDSALFTHKDDLTVYTQEVVDMTSFELKLDNANLSLYSNIFITASSTRVIGTSPFLTALSSA